MIPKPPNHSIPVLSIAGDSLKTLEVQLSNTFLEKELAALWNQSYGSRRSLPARLGVENSCFLLLTMHIVDTDPFSSRDFMLPLQYCCRVGFYNDKPASILCTCIGYR
jgi:hypothetical protein